ncbi:glycosyltransferase family 61 protein [Pseudohyphozyma bogoriensis]|nr:glycosyltransferase family 61 protein [Pseudohyphozyma bogoriensis]
MRCHFKNVCIRLLEPLDPYATYPTMNPPSSVEMIYYRPSSAREAPVFWYDGHSNDMPWVRIDRDSGLTPSFKFNELPQDAWWAPAETTVLTEAFWPENFGHALGDDYLPVYRLAKSFSLWSRDIGVIFHPSCARRDDPLRGCSHHSEIAPLLLSRPVETDISDLWPADDSPVCFKNLLVGTRELGMGYSGESWPGFVAEMKKYVGVPEFPKLKKQKISIFLKRGRRTLLNYEELRDHLVKRFEVEVELKDPSEFSLEEQIAWMQSTSVVVSPCGGVSFSAIFLPPGASAIFVDYWNANWNSTAQMERHIYSYNSLVTPFYYPLEFGDLSYDPLKLPEEAKKSDFVLYRDYVNVNVSLERMERYVLAALLQAEVSFGWTRSFKHDSPIQPAGTP